MFIDAASQAQLQAWETEFSEQFQALKNQNLQLDLTRGKPSNEQLSLSDQLDGILDGNYRSADGTDTRNYGGLDGLTETKTLGGHILGVDPANVLVGGNSSLSLMYITADFGLHHGFEGKESAWANNAITKFLCPVPGYDRHFSVSETLGMELIAVPMLATGPDMDVVEKLVASDPCIKGMWCVPKYSNPTGVVYSDETVDRIAQLGNIAGPHFRVFWDNAYAVHDLTDPPKPLANITKACQQYGTENSVIQFASSSKITQAGAGISFLSASTANLNAIKKVLGMMTIGPDKVNQLRHCKLLPDLDAVKAHMKKHAEIIRPRFETVLKTLDQHFSDSDLGSWQRPEGGYFISFDTRPNCAKNIVRLAAETGVKLTPAGATFPYGKDPDDKNIRIAPTVPSVAELEKAMNVFVTCVKLVSVRQRLSEM